MDRMNRLAPPSPSHRLTALLFTFALAGLAGACQSKPAAPPISANAWAVVNGHEISRDEVEKAFRRAAPPTPVPSDEEALTAKLNLLNDLIVQDLLLAKARELKIELPDTELDTAYNDAKKNVPDETFKQELAQRNLTAADMREGLRRDLLTQKVFEKEVTSKVNVTDQDITDFFTANKAQFNRPEEGYHLAQIAITPVRDAGLNNRAGDDASTPQEATAKAQMIMERLKGGAAFSELAADFSEDPQSAPRGGDLGFVPMSALKQAPPALRDAVLNTAPGTVKVVSQGGAHTLVLVVAHDTAGQKDPSMPEVKDAIKTTLHTRREQLLRAAYVSALRNDAVVVNQLAKRLVESQGKTQGLAAAAPAAK